MISSEVLLKLIRPMPTWRMSSMQYRLNNLQCWDAETVRVILRTEGVADEAIVRALVCPDVSSFLIQSVWPY